MDFLKDIEIKGGEEGIHLITSPKDGRPNGEAFIECADEKDFDAAFDFNKKVMGHRYIESECYINQAWKKGVNINFL